MLHLQKSLPCHSHVSLLEHSCILHVNGSPANLFGIPQDFLFFFLATTIQLVIAVTYLIKYVLRLTPPRWPEIRNVSEGGYNI